MGVKPGLSIEGRTEWVWEQGAEDNILLMKLLIMQFSPSSRHFISLRSKYSPQQTHSVYVPPLMSETMFHTHTEPQAKLQYSNTVAITYNTYSWEEFLLLSLCSTTDRVIPAGSWRPCRPREIILYTDNASSPATAAGQVSTACARTSDAQCLFMSGCSECMENRHGPPRYEHDTCMLHALEPATAAGFMHSHFFQTIFHLPLPHSFSRMQYVLLCKVVPLLTPWKHSRGRRHSSTQSWRRH
jgi:hypothetical protein